MDRFEELKNFIPFAQKFLVKQTEELSNETYLKTKKYNDLRNKLPHIIEIQRRYETSEKGRIQKRMRNAHHGFYRSSKIKDCDEIQFKKIRKFYLETPEGHHVDHVIPICAGGQHCLENLQYLKATINLRKFKRVTTNDKVSLMRNRFIRIL